ncbi:hypothetical protein FQ192_17415 [Pseudomonas sp. ANT_J12]|uniref:hypothetical protein n=1 Tax=Pseudomonas sp. ANT_J12 TaxID=2597351 RepID=UPI0011F10D41|nr:hypothetical protein [Pseudomonas sp. ANT_J12]KAA0988250.1 hypothetical protein FQ192_17415 [Pseudomonas sp. ANT_J12]
MTDLNVVVYRTRPLTDRNDIFQVLGRIEGGLFDMEATILGVSVDGLGSIRAYGAALADSNFSIIVHLQDVGRYTLYVIPIYTDGVPRYQFSSKAFEVVVQSNV